MPSAIESRNIGNIPNDESILMSDAQPNYSKEEEARLLSLYEELGTAGIEEIAAKLNKPVRSVRSKLVSAKVYKPLPKPTSRRKSDSKKQLLNELENLVGFDTSGFNGSTKDVLSHLIAFLKTKDNLK